MAKKIVRKKAIPADTVVINFRVPEKKYREYVKKYPTFHDRKSMVTSLRDHFCYNVAKINK